MPPRKAAATASQSSASTTTATSSTTISSTTPTTTSAQPPKLSSSSSVSSRNSNSQDPSQIAATLWNNYIDKTPSRTKLIDVFMGFLVVVGVLQFVYCVVAGNYPFNAFLAGFSATVGQFVLTASLRIQTDAANGAEFAKISHERAFADFVFGSMILHFFCVNFIN